TCPSIPARDPSLPSDTLPKLPTQCLPPNETNERHFRLLIAVLNYLHAGGSIWAAVTYFALWSVRLAGFLPELRVSDESREIVEEMLVTPIQQLASRAWARETATDVRRALNRLIEDHVERKLRTTVILEALCASPSLSRRRSSD